MKLDLSEIARTPGSYAEHKIDNFLLQNGSEIGANYPINGKLIFQSTGRVLVIMGGFTTQVDEICDRCAGAAIVDIKADIAEDFSVNPTQNETRGRGEKHMPLVEEDEDTKECHLFYEGTFDLNLDELIRQNIVLSMPLKFLCNENCTGLCMNCGKPLTLDKECDCQSSDINPQFEALKNYFEDKN